MKLHFSSQRICLLLMLLLMTGVGKAAEFFSAEDTQKFNNQLDTAEKSLPGAKENPLQLGELQNQAINLSLQAQNCINEYEQQQTQTKQDLDSLGKATPEEDAEVKVKRKQLETQKQQIEKNLSQCRLLNLRAKTVENTARTAAQKITTEQLFTASPSILTLQLNLLREPERWQTETTAIARILLSPPINWKNLLMALGYGMAGMLVGFLWSTYKRRYYRQTEPVMHNTSPTLEVVWRSIINIIPYALFAGLTSLSLSLAPAGVPEIMKTCLTLLIFSLSYAVLRAILRSRAKIEGVERVNVQAGKQIYFWAKVLLVATLVGIVFHWPALDTFYPEGTMATPTASHLPVEIPESTSTADKAETAPTPPPTAQIQLQTNNLVGLMRIACGTLIGFTLMRLVWLLAAHFRLLQIARIHVGVGIALMIAIGSLWIGYRNLSSFLFSGVFGTLFLLLATWLLLRIPTEIFDGLDEGRAPWQQHIRQQIGLKPNQIMPGLLWIRLTHTLAISGLMVLALLRLWGMSEQTLTVLLNQVVNGITIGGLKLEPLRLLGGILVFVLLFSFAKIFKEHLADTWLRRTTLSRGAREATTIISGYVGIVLAIILGLSVAGIEFKNLAIIAGALSVGIGFGLQNIVNNFVSGLILLFERPIRKGDWIKVGNAEGYVREISIRSTTIQTFDRSDIIVPNSELISGQVVNMMLNDNYGRILIPISVSYGSDTELVMQLLREVAMAHPVVIKDRNDMKINVFFRGFGETSLNFELRCFVREVETKSSVTSDLNLSIDKVFRQYGVDVPLPQRTVHVVPTEPETAPAVAKPTETPVKP